MIDDDYIPFEGIVRTPPSKIRDAIIRRLRPDLHPGLTPPDRSGPKKSGCGDPAEELD